MDGKDLEQLEKNLNLENDRDDKTSVITQDKLKKFNEIYGYEHGPAVEGAQDEDDHQEE